jgi:hypothetical protein
VSLELAAGREPASRRSIWNWLLGGRGGLVLAGAAACALLAVVLFRPPVPPKGTVAQVSQPEKLRPMMIRDGTRVVSIAANGTISGLEHLPDNDRVLLQHVLAEKQIAPPQSLADLETKAGVLLGAPGETSPGQLLEPLSIVVESQRPTFRWQPVAGATYRVSVYDADYNLVAQSGAISAPEWQVPQPLRRGARYSWQIAVTQNGAEFNVPTPPAPEARFRVVSDADEAGIRRARAEAPDSRLLLGVLYARAGMLKEAGQELRALQQQNPDSAEITALLASIQNLRRPSAQ